MVEKLTAALPTAQRRTFVGLYNSRLHSADPQQPSSQRLLKQRHEVVLKVVLHRANERFVCLQRAPSHVQLFGENVITA